MGHTLVQYIAIERRKKTDTSLFVWDMAKNGNLVYVRIREYSIFWSHIISTVIYIKSNRLVCDICAFRLADFVVIGGQTKRVP